MEKENWDIVDATQFSVVKNSKGQCRLTDRTNSSVILTSWHGYYENALKELAKRKNYWKCNHCGNIEYVEREIYCWECGIGEMIYRGK